MRRAIAAFAVILAAGCAPPPPVVPMPAVPAHPDFVFPAAPPDTPPATLQLLDRGWRLLQSDDVAAAEREFAAVLRTRRAFAPALAGQGYVELARRRADEAVGAFDRAVAAQPAYAPALVGRGLALLAAGRDDEALAGFEAALAADPSLADLAPRIEALRVRQLQDRVARAERAAAAGRWDDARAAYRAAIAASPESAFLYRDLARAELRAGRPDAALAEAERALALDADDVRAHLVVGEVREGRDDHVGALAAYERAAALDPTPSTAAAIARMRERARIAALPAQYHAIASAPAATRADLAALLAVRLGARLAAAPQRQLVVTDVRGHWAQPWIEATARAGAMEVFSNYTFQPATQLRRADVAEVVSRVLALGPGGGAATARWDLSPVEITDVPAAHLAYPAVRRAVASGVMRLDGGAFRLLQPVTGEELTAIVSRLEALGIGP
ncbi:MAG: tetratricopeptide repeat protein [Vicinamibacterales bacterium]